MKPASGIACLLGLSLGAPCPGWCGVDPFEAARQLAGPFQRADAPAGSLYWDPVAGQPYLVSAPGPVLVSRLGWRGILLAPGQEIGIHVPAHALLRVVTEDAAATAPEFFISDGTGLAVPLAAQPSAGHDGWLLRSPLAHAALIHVRGTGTARRLGFFLGRFEPPMQALLYRRPLPLPGETVRVRRADETVPRPYTRIRAGQEVRLSATGPGELAVDFQLDASADPRETRIALEVSTGSGAPLIAQQLTGPESVAPRSIDGVWYPGVRSERVAVKLPPGEHVVRLRPSHAILVRPTTHDVHDFLLPGLNMPPAWQDIAPLDTLAELEQRAIAAAASNLWRDGGMAVAQAMDRAAGAYPGVPSLRQSADELAQQFSAYRSLPPSTLPRGAVAATYVWFFRLPQAPDAPPRHDIRSAVTPPAALPTDDFHRLSDGPLHYVLGESTHPRRLRLLVSNRTMALGKIELRDDRGAVSFIDIAAVRLDEARLTPLSGPVTAALDPGAVLPPALPVLPVSTVEWQVPAGVRSVSVRLTNPPGQFKTAAPGVLLSLQELRSADYVLDDQFLSRLASEPRAGGPGGLLLTDALRPFERRLVEARRQFLANVVPIGPQTGPAPGLIASDKRKQLEENARKESAADPARAFELWTQLARSGDADLQGRALRGQSQALLAAGERFAAERLLRGYWAGADPRLAHIAGEELVALYAREGDLAMLAQFAAARAATDRAAYADLAKAFAAEGEDGLALQTGLLAVPRDLPLLLQAALRSRQWQTFDALLAQVDRPQEAAFWRMQRALGEGRADAARSYAAEAGSPAWVEALRRAADIAPRLGTAQAPAVRAAAVNDWLGWQQDHPGPRLWVREAGIVRQHGGGVVLRNVSLDLPSTWWRASKDTPLRVRLVGPVRIRVEARPVHADSAGLASGWLRVGAPGQHWVQPFRQNQVAPGLALDGDQGLPGIAVMREILLPAGIHTLDIDAGAVPVIARVLVERPGLGEAGLPLPRAAYFEESERGRADPVPDPHCGGLHGCQIAIDTKGSRLHGRQFRATGASWPGLPAPAPATDRTAGLLAAGDVFGAFQSSSDPVEKMGLLLWLAETHPAERARALAYGAALAERYPTKEVVALWQTLEAQSSWSVMPIVDRSAGLRAIEVPAGTPEAPSARIRAAMLGPLRAGEMLLGGGSRATLLLNRTAAAPLTVELRAEAVPGMPFLPFSAVVERNGKQVGRVLFDRAASRQAVRLALPPGEQQIAVRLETQYANQFARVQFSGAADTLPAFVREWHIASRAQPVQLTVPGPAWVRVDRRTPDGIRSEQRFVTSAIAHLSLQVQPEERETLYRVFVRQADPQPATPKLPPPNAYRPERMAEAPSEWLDAGLGAGPRVRFTDPYPLAARTNATWSGHVGIYRRQDAESTGGETGQQVERFVQAGIAWRQGSAEGSMFRHVDAFVRHHVLGSPSVGLAAGLERSVPWTAAWPYPFDASAAVAAVAQQTPDGTGAALTANAALSQDRLLGATLSHQPSLGINARALSLNHVTDPDRVDNDVFTRYRKQHRWGLAMTDTLSWRPWRDSHASARASIVGNPNLNLFKPDHVSVDAQWRQMAGEAIVDAGMRVIRFMADKDRAEGVTRRDLHLGASWERWLGDGSRLELRAEARRNLAAGVNWGALELRWHWGAGRGLRDFSAREIDFRSLRSWRAPGGSAIAEVP